MWPSARNTRTLTTISAIVSSGRRAVLRSVLTDGALARAHRAAHATGVVVMQSGQIGRPQFEHETPVLGARVA